MMKTGRGLETWIGEHLFGLDRTKQYEIPDYLTSPSDAWKIVEKLRLEEGFYFELTTAEPFSLQLRCRFQLNDLDVESIGDTMEEAICLAALQVIEKMAMSEGK